MLEIEAKLKVASHAAVRQRLEACSARFLSRVLEENHIYDRSDGSLRAAGCGLRVRRCRVLGGRPVSDTLTYKGPRQPGPYKQRPEISLAVHSAGDARALLAGLDCVEVMRFEKRRETWELGGCQVALDEVPHLGTYVEIEGPDTETIRRVQHQLGLGSCPHVPPGYVSLLGEFCSRAGLDARALSFPAAGR